MSTADRVWQYMKDYQKEAGRPPTMREIADQFEEFSHHSAPQYTIQQLEKQGRVEATGEPGSARRYEAVERPDRVPDNPFTMEFVPHVEAPE